MAELHVISSRVVEQLRTLKRRPGNTRHDRQRRRPALFPPQSATPVVLFGKRAMSWGDDGLMWGFAWTALRYDPAARLMVLDHSRRSFDDGDWYAKPIYNLAEYPLRLEMHASIDGIAEDYEPSGNKAGDDVLEFGVVDEMLLRPASTGPGIRTIDRVPPSLFPVQCVLDPAFAQFTGSGTDGGESCDFRYNVYSVDDILLADSEATPMIPRRRRVPLVKYLPPDPISDPVEGLARWERVDDRWQIALVDANEVEDPNFC
jgi:hypothetical protein